MLTNLRDLRLLHRRAIARSRSVVAAVRPDDLTRPTPCSAWNLHTLLGHVIGQHHGFAHAVEAPDAPLRAFAGRPPAPHAILLDWATSAERLTTAFAAAPLDRRVLLVELSSDHRFPVATAVGFQLVDTVVHTWDIATAIGQHYRPDDQLVAATLDQAEKVPTGEARDRPDATFAPVVPEEGTDDWTRTLALLGRQRWGGPELGGRPALGSSRDRNRDDGLGHLPGALEIGSGRGGSR